MLLLKCRIWLADCFVFRVVLQTLTTMNTESIRITYFHYLKSNFVVWETLLIIPLIMSFCCKWLHIWTQERCLEAGKTNHLHFTAALCVSYVLLCLNADCRVYQTCLLAINSVSWHWFLQGRCHYHQTYQWFKFLWKAKFTMCCQVCHYYVCHLITSFI